MSQEQVVAGTTSPVPSPSPTAPTAAPPSRRGRGRPGLGSAYWKVWTASSISTLGDGIRFVAMPLAAAQLTHDARTISLVTVAGFAPWLLFSLISGALVDRWDRRRVMWSADLFRCAVVGGFTLAVALDHNSVALVIVVSFLLGTAETLFDNASQSILPALVGRDRLARANGRLYSGQVIGQQFLGPPLGGLLFAALVWSPFAADATSFLIASLLVLTVRGQFREPRDPDAPPTRIRTEVAEGVRWLWHNRLLRALCSMLGIWNLTATAATAVEVLWALEVLHLDARGFGFLGLGFAAGSLIGSVMAERVSKFMGEGPALYASIAATIVADLVAWSTANAFVAGASFALVGFAALVWNVITVSLRQEIIPPRLLGRVNSAYRFVGWGSIPLGGLLGGFVAHAFGLRAPFLVAAVVLVVCGALLPRAVTSASIAAARAEVVEGS